MLKTKQEMQLARLVQVIVQAARRVAGRGPETQVRRRGVTWALDLREGIDFSLWLLGAFEPETITCYQRLIRPGDVVLDIDGAECEMLRGAADSLRRWHPAIVMELAPYVLEEKGSSLAELVGILCDYGYRLFDASTGARLPEEVSQLNARIPAGASLNVVARAG